MIGVAAPQSLAEWRESARRLLGSDIPPAEIIWSTTSLFGATHIPASEKVLRVPRSFFSLAESVACHRDVERWPLLYRLLWRLTHGEPHLLAIESDSEMVRATGMSQAVHRDEHKMKAFVRFRVVRDAMGEEHYIAWHRPDHFVVPRVAPFFVERFHSMRWSILTPDASADWDLKHLTLGPGAKRSDAPQDDQLEDLWRDYYASIYNPARTNLTLMQQHVPKKHWATLPELRDFQQLVQLAPARVAEMVSRTTPEKLSAAAWIPTGAPDLPKLREAAAGCQGCELYKSATQTVFGEGPPSARIVCVGEQPGDQEDLAGKPFIGPAGEIFDRALSEAGIARRELYITNAVKHFKWIPRGKKRLHQKPSAREVKACQPWLEAELGLLKPELIVCLGATAAQAVLGAHVKISELRGQLVPTSRAKSCLVTFHPSAVLRAEDGAQIYAALVADLRLAACSLHPRPDSSAHA